MQLCLELCDTSLKLVDSALERVHQLVSERSHCVCGEEDRARGKGVFGSSD